MYTADDVRKVREVLDCSMGEAVATLRRRENLRIIKEAKTLEDLKPLLINLVHRTCVSGLRVTDDELEEILNHGE